jgi:hypothetical protein
MIALGLQYTHRYGKTHMSITKCLEELRTHPDNIPNEDFKQPPQCMPDEYKDKCSIQAYWNYYIGEKHSVANKNEDLIKRIVEWNSIKYPKDNETRIIIATLKPEGAVTTAINNI